MVLYLEACRLCSGIAGPSSDCKCAGDSRKSPVGFPAAESAPNLGWSLPQFLQSCRTTRRENTWLPVRSMKPRQSPGRLWKKSLNHLQCHLLKAVSY